MRNLKNELRNRTIDYNKLTKYGFKKENEEYIYKTKILNEQFEVIIDFSERGSFSKIIDTR